MAIGFNQGSIYKDVAQKSADAASLSADAAAISAAAAQAAEQSTSSSETAAAESETNAAASAVTAGNSEVAAELAETNAAASEAAALVSEDAAAQSWLDMDKVYLGDKAADPALDNQGAALAAGSWYLNTVTMRARGYDGSDWTDFTGVGVASFEEMPFTATAGQTTFTLPEIYLANTVYVDGALVSNADYSINIDQLVFTVGLTVGQEVIVVGVGGIPIEDGVVQIEHGDILGLTDDDHVGYSLADGTRAFTGAVTLSGDPTADLHAAPKQYVDDVREDIYVTNRVHNQSFRVCTRGVETVVSAGTSGAISADRWIFEASLTGSDAGVIEAAGFSALGSGRASVMESTATHSGPAAGEFMIVQQGFEGFSMEDLLWGTSDAVDVTITFTTRSTVAGDLAVSIRSSGGDASYVVDVAVDGLDALQTHTVVIPGATIGTWGATSAVWGRLAFSVDTGSTYQTPAVDTWQAGLYFGSSSTLTTGATSGDYVTVNDVQLERGSRSTTRRVMPYGTEVQVAARYYQIGGGYRYMHAIQGDGSSTYRDTYVEFRTEMRATPTVVLGGVSGGAIVTDMSAYGFRAYYTVPTPASTAVFSSWQASAEI